VPDTAPAFDGIVVADAGAERIVGGLPLLERAAFVLARAGARRLLVVGAEAAAGRRLPDTPSVWGRSGDATAVATWLATAAPTVVVMAATTVTEPAAVTALVQAEPPGPLAVTGEARLWRSDPRALDARTLASVSPPATAWTPPPGLLIRSATAPLDRRAAEAALYARLGRDGDGWFTRHVDRRVSRALTRLLVPTGASPNAVTITSIAIGIAGGWCFAQGTPDGAMAGALLFLASTIVDGCDGEIARLTFRESALGARLDLLGDNLVHLFLFGGIALGLYRRSADPVVAGLGVALVGGVVLAMAAVYWCLVRRPPTRRQTRLFEAFASREFAYLLVVLTLAGRLDWFLWLSALGTYVFAAGLFALGRDRDG
jgi:phosphatidylglycerophosphate synthase